MLLQLLRALWLGLAAPLSFASRTVCISDCCCSTPHPRPACSASACRAGLV